MNALSFVLLLIVGLLTGCFGSSGSTSELVLKRDTTITRRNSFSELFLDSSKLDRFIISQKLSSESANRIKSFYNTRNYQFAWFTKDGLAEQARAFWNLHNSYIDLSKDSSLLDKRLHEKMEVLLSDDFENVIPRDEITETELQLTQHFFDYVQYAYAGRVDPEELQWHILRKKVDARSLLDSLIAGEGKNIDYWEPVNRQYKLMRNMLRRYYDIRQANWDKILLSKAFYKPGDSAYIIKQVKQRLILVGDLEPGDSSQVFSQELTGAVLQAQKRFGCKQDGFISSDFINALNVPLTERIKQLLINMERMRWMPSEASGSVILVNIPDFKLHVFQNSKKIFDMNIVVGTAANKTVVFNDVIKYIVFQPYWNVPPSIVKKEILPALNRDRNYLNKHNMEQTGVVDGLPVIRQRPGGANALGRIKFVFPNSYNIYLHDTPAKSLFQSRDRAFSHGCIRLENPAKLAEYLLGNEPGWTAEKIDAAMDSSQEKWVPLTYQIPVFITYFTAWIDSDGLLNFRKDVYGNDEKMAARLFLTQD